MEAFAAALGMLAAAGGAAGAGGGAWRGLEAGAVYSGNELFAELTSNEHGISRGAWRGLEAGAVVGDMGCGTGNLLLPLARRFPQVSRPALASKCLEWFKTR